jgi:hypothetical protein
VNFLVGGSGRHDSMLEGAGAGCRTRADRGARWG